MDDHTLLRLQAIERRLTAIEEMQARIVAKIVDGTPLFPRRRTGSFDGTLNDPHLEVPE